MFKKYYQLTKPGIIYGNILTATAGFLLASRHHIDVLLLLETLAGTSLIIGSGCVFNNYMDRGIDAKMARTKKRALVQETIPVANALLFGSIIGLIGFCILSVFTSTLVFYIGLIGFIDYVVLYGYFKRRSVHGTLVGSISGATPILAGYCAARGHFDSGAAIVFLIMAVWQMPHFYGIAMYRFKDYKAAGIPVLPVAKNMRAAKLQTLVYIIGFIVACALLTLYSYTGYIFLGVMVIVSLMWFIKGIRLYNIKEDSLWGRKMFLFSLIVVMTLSAMLSVGARLP
ncbi:MAG: cyoE [Candidatus Saccharibacteria bacterium]|nr:cyoE [Candidatus Saccharibacteria bacterium]